MKRRLGRAEGDRSRRCQFGCPEPEVVAHRLHLLDLLFLGLHNRVRMLLGLRVRTALDLRLRQRQEQLKDSRAVGLV